MLYKCMKHLKYKLKLLPPNFQKTKVKHGQHDVHIDKDIPNTTSFTREISKGLLWANGTYETKKINIFYRAKEMVC